MGLTADQIRTGMDHVAAQAPALGRALSRVGYPEPRIRDRGWRTLLRTIVGQQVSVAAAASVWSRLEALLGQGMAPAAVLRPLRPQVTSNVMLVRRKARSLKPNAAAVWDNLRAQEYDQALLKKVG